MKKIVLFFSLVLSVTPLYGQETKNSSNLSVGVAHCCIRSDVFMWNIAQDIKAELEKAGVKQVLFESADGSQAGQIAQTEKLTNSDVKAIISALVIDDTVEKKFQAQLMQVAQRKNLPIIFYTIAPKANILQAHNNAYFVGSEPAQSGILQGELIIEQWNKHPEWDKNKDGVIQYAIVRGPAGNPDAEARTKWVQATIKSYPTLGIKAELVDLKFGNWNRKQAEQIVEDWLSNPDNGIEVIIANNDDMALGAINVIQSHGLWLPVFGVDALPEAITAIKNGKMSGTIKQDGAAQAQTAARLALNLAAGLSPDHALDYQIINRKINIPYVKVDANNLSKFN